MLANDCQRKIDYLRISVTDKCNLRCTYCMPDKGIINKPHDEILTFEEILRLVNIFVSLGVRKVRLTGGEPLVRKRIVNLVRSLSKIERLEDLSLTTNGSLLSRYAETLKEAGLKRINISLDTLKETKFKKITRRDCFYDVIKGIDKAKELGFYPLKLNMVVMKNINEDEIIDFVDFAVSKGLDLRFIEFMKVTPLWRGDYFIPIEEVKEICEKKYRLRYIDNIGSSPAKYYRIRRDEILGFIKTDERTCKSCSRLRLASTGELKICLYENEGLKLKKLLRSDISNEEIKDIIKMRLGMKEDIDYRSWESQKVYMCNIGG